MLSVVAPFQMFQLVKFCLHWGKNRSKVAALKYFFLQPKQSSLPQVLPHFTGLRLFEILAYVTNLCLCNHKSKFVVILLRSQGKCTFMSTLPKDRLLLLAIVPISLYLCPPCPMSQCKCTLISTLPKDYIKFRLLLLAIVPIKTYLFICVHLALWANCILISTLPKDKVKFRLLLLAIVPTKIYPFICGNPAE